MSSENMLLKIVTFFVFHLDISGKDFKDEHPLNIENIPNTFSLLTAGQKRRYDKPINQRGRRVASDCTAKGAADSETAARTAEVNGLLRALRKQERVGSDGRPLPLSRRRVSRCTRQSVLPFSGSKAEWHHGNSASAHRTCALGRFSFPRSGNSSKF